MNGYVIFTMGVFLGVCSGFILASWFSAAHDGDHDWEVLQAYQYGFTNGLAGFGLLPSEKPSADDSFECCGVKPVTAEQIFAQNVNRLDREVEG